MGVSEQTDRMGVSEQTDVEAVEALRAGNTSALGILYDRYGESVHRFALRMLGHKQEAEDLTQEVFLTFWQGDAFNPNRGSLLVFLMMLTRSRAINRLHQRNIQQHFLQRLERNVGSHDSNTPLDRAALEELSQQVRNALRKIPENQRQTLEMAYFDGLSQSEITEQLKIPLGTVKTRSRQGLLKLRQLLKDWVDDRL
jgi:RNA polymerase sigma-70 factor, ECF subfamily